MSHTRLARVALGAYLGIVLALTLVPVPGDPDKLSLVPFAGIRRTYVDRGMAFGTFQVVGNLLLLAPAGALLPYAVPGARFRHVVLGALALSVGIEAAQWAVGVGRSADIDDVWMNTLGAAAGWVVVHR